MVLKESKIKKKKISKTDNKNKQERHGHKQNKL